MRRHKHHGFTVVELLVVIVVVALLATITTVTYRSVQADARNEKRKADAMMLRAAAEDYHADNGTYPRPTCIDGPGGTNECSNNEAWQMLLDGGYISRIPTSDGMGNYTWLWSSHTSYGIRIHLESPMTTCKIGKNVGTTWWGSIPVCDF